MRFRDRDDAGRQLASALDPLQLDDPLVLGLPRGGVPVAAVVADLVGGDLGVVVARKIGAPGHPEYGIGAIAEHGGAVVDERVVAALGLSSRAVRRAGARRTQGVGAARGAVPPR